MFLNHKELDYNGSQIFFKGVIEDNDDPLLYGRVRVRVMGVHTENKTDVPTSTLPWATISRSLDYGGLQNGYGLSSIPQVGTWVFLFFDLGEYDKPVIIGAIAGKDNGNFSLDSNYKTTHKIKTPANHIIEINDGTSEMKILHSNGCELLLSNEGITMTSSNTTNIITLNDMETNTLGTVNHNSSGSTSITSGASANISAATTINISASGKVTISSGSDIDILSGGTIKLQSATNTMVI